MVKGKLSGYQHKYYEAHRDELSARKRFRYQTDPEYKGRLLESAKERQQLISRVNAVVGEADAPVERGMLREKVVEIGGKAVVLKSIGALSGVVASTPEAVKFWEKGGVIPPPTFLDNFGRRWYSREYVAAVRMAFEEWKGFGGMKRLKRLVEKEFTEVSRD